MRAPAEGGKPDFIGRADRYCENNRSSFAFFLLRLHLGSSKEDLDQVIKKIYCASIRENTYAIPEPAWKTFLGLLLLPFSYLAKKRLFWSPAPTVDWTLETIDEAYFRRWFLDLFDRLPGRKQVTPREAWSQAGIPATEPIPAAVRPRDVLKLLVLCPFMVPAVFWLSSRTGMDIFKAYRQAISLYNVFRGYFSRYPCHNFITYDDELNHPSRWLAFRQGSSGKFVVIQNGERLLHPHFAFGRMDFYFVFGAAYEEILRKIGVLAEEFPSVGALCLNERFGLVQAEQGRAAAPEWDILFVDQGFLPFHGFNSRSEAALVALIRHLGLLKTRHPEFRVAYQLRPYGTDAAQKRHVLSELDGMLPPDVARLDNAGAGESYRNIIRSRLVLTFESTLGFEALMLGRPVLFVNYSDDPAETICPDRRFQHEDPTADYGAFERRVLELLKISLGEIPAAARDRHHAFDGRVQERIAGRLLEEQS